MDLVPCILLQFLCFLQDSNCMEDRFTVDRQMEKTSYQIVSATRSTDTKTPKYVTVIRAPINTNMVKNGFSRSRGTAEWQLDMRDETMPDDHIASMAINRTALIQDGVQVKSLEFVIHTLGNDFKTDVIDEYVYRYTLI